MEAANYSILLESDEGVFTPYGMRFTGSDAAKEVCIYIFSVLIPKLYLGMYYMV